MSHTTALATITPGTDPAYNGYMGELRQAATRPEAAQTVMTLSSIADSISSAIITAGPVTAEEEGTTRDPLVWAEVATQLNRMALALNGAILCDNDYHFLDREDSDEWEDLSHATTRKEFAAAWAPLKEELTGRATPADTEDGELRPLAVTLICAVAAAVMDARW
jgi:hypothetical protein